MSTYKKISLTDRSANFIELTAKRKSGETIETAWSSAINSALNQLQLTVSASMPELTNDEWQTILSCYAGCYFPAYDVPVSIASDLMDSAGAESLDELVPWYGALVEKVGEMNQAHQMAIIYFVQIFWTNDLSHCADFDQIKAEIINKLK